MALWWVEPEAGFKIFFALENVCLTCWVLDYGRVLLIMVPSKPLGEPITVMWQVPESALHGPL
jgi:hypothetical protein